MNAPERFFLPDVQASADHRELAIQRVGVKSVRYPLRLRTADGEVTHTVATLNMYVALRADQKGTHMSRFLEILERDRDALPVDAFGEVVSEMVRHLDAEEGHIEAAFPYFVRKQAPVSGVESLLDIDVVLAVTKRAGHAPRTTLRVTVPVTSLCPCSKKISRYGAHNQRSHITIQAELRETILVEELVRFAEEEASCEIYGLLKRPDEKYVTERAYENPKFVEDLVRDIALRLGRDPRVRRYTVESENFESIHNHSAYALIEGENP